jgi:hypothetical protein
MLYAVTAFALSFVWLAALAFTPGLGLAIQGGTEEVFSLSTEVIWALFPVISVFIALTFKQWILSCRRWRMFIPAIVLPWIGSLVIALACGIALAHQLHSICMGNSLTDTELRRAWQARQLATMPPIVRQKDHEPT